MPDEKQTPTADDEQAAVMALAAAMKRWGIKPEDLGPRFRGLMAFTPDEVPLMIDEPKEETRGICCGQKYTRGPSASEVIMNEPHAAEPKPLTEEELDGYLTFAALNHVAMTPLQLEVAETIRRLVDEVRRLRAEHRRS
jgi:hypothetical protein